MKSTPHFTWPYFFRNKDNGSVRDKNTTGASIYKHAPPHPPLSSLFTSLFLSHQGFKFSTMATLSLFIFSLISTSLYDFSFAMTTITAMAKDQISCTMCSSCDNPCQPILSPPPPPSPPPPSPPSPTGPNCPPPPSPPTSGGGGGVYYFSPPPPTQQSYYPPPYGGGGSGGGGAYNPPSNFPTPPPPNPIVQYFPYYYHSPPTPSGHSDDYNSMQIKTLPFISLFLIILPFLYNFQNYNIN